MARRKDRKQRDPNNPWPWYVDPNTPYNQTDYGYGADYGSPPAGWWADNYKGVYRPNPVDMDLKVPGYIRALEKQAAVKLAAAPNTGGFPYKANPPTTGFAYKPFDPKTGGVPKKPSDTPREKTPTGAEADQAGKYAWTEDDDKAWADWKGALDKFWEGRGVDAPRGWYDPSQEGNSAFYSLEGGVGNLTDRYTGQAAQTAVYNYGDNPYNYGQTRATGQRGSVIGRSKAGQAWLDANKYKLKLRKEGKDWSKQFGKGKGAWQKKGGKGKGAGGGGGEGIARTSWLGALADLNI